MGVRVPPLSEVELTVISGDSTRAEIEEALAHCVATAARLPTYDGLSRLSADHERLHRFLNYLLDLWQAS